MKVQYHQYNITSNWKGDKAAPWSEKDKYGPNFNRSIITIFNRNTKARISFDFWGSIAYPELRNRYDHLNAFYCFVSDAISGDMDFEEFCSEFCYDTDSRKAEQTWKACHELYKKALKVISEDLYDFANELGEKAA